MCCTFGDLTDVQWWRELRLPTRVVLQRDGRLQGETPEWLINAEPYAALAGKTIGAQGSTIHQNYAEATYKDSTVKSYPTAEEYKLDLLGASSQRRRYGFLRYKLAFAIVALHDQVGLF